MADEVSALGKSRRNPSHTMIAEKIGRFAWIGFVILAIPSALFCVTILAIAVRMLFIEDNGPVETLPLNPLEVAAAWTCLAAHPAVLLVSIFTSYRFNEAFRAMLPFLLNLFPVAALFYFVCMTGDPESKANDSAWPAWYLAAVALPLAVGLGASFAFSIRARPLERGNS